ncbi:Protein of unknown function [Tistlia consotensis]|uniref:Uncharacterized protein n=1 Tax=Tistlia consotensis USBA 355 TaxID=560819 RepID=A0A1Y6CS35_9PROT|nr:DUF2786 domain-containing protein [Tistlia consotensis]SMF86205.1 Protein of unknown function [Tistlia consotensis USBA 355]SNS39673.1 Protein of unknown function [Tistlia consotensis]
MSERLDAVKTKIRALRARTVARGCTEAEAATAMEMAARLMRDHGLDEADLEMAQVECQRPATAKAHARDRLAAVVAYCTNCAGLKTIRWGGARCFFVGPAPLAEIAAYTRDLCEAAIDRELRAFQRTPAYTRKRSQKTRGEASRAFVEGMVSVLALRLRDAFRGQRNEAIAARSGAWLDRLEPDAASVGKAKPTRDPRAADQGAAAARRVELSAGVGADRRDGALDGPRRLIGGPA